MDDYPSSMTALEKRFALREDCLSYLASLRWPSGYVCPRCGSDKSWTMENGLILCSGCRRQQSVTAGTVFQDSHMGRHRGRICTLDKTGLKRTVGMW